MGYIKESIEKNLKEANNIVKYDSYKTIHQLIEEQANKCPDNIALIFNNAKMTYKELNKKSNQLADILRSKAVKPDSVVAIMLNRSFDMVIGILAILKAGGAFLPIDHEYPQGRLEYILKDSNASILLTNKSLKDKINFDNEIIYICDCLYTENNINITNKNKATDLAYVIYTSGSTGYPKGVMIEHKALHNFVNGITDKIDFFPDKTILAATTTSFDISILELLLPLTKGMSIVIANENEQKNPKLLGDLIIKKNVDILQITPSRMQLLLNYHKDIGFLEGVKELLIGGEPLTKNLFKQLKSLSTTKIYNMYGPTETTIWSTLKEVANEDEISVGTPICNTQIYVVDNCGKLLQPGSEGELFISGDGLARGYINNSELTNEQFIDNPFVPGQRMYKTGDLVKLMPNGEIYYIGRIDNQIKLRGFRIEPMEIESQLLKIECIESAIVTAKMNDNDKYLCAYIVCNDSFNQTEIKKLLAKTLPDYMIPSVYIQLDEIPLTHSGKIDINALPEPQYNLNDELELEEIISRNKINQNPIEVSIRKIMADNCELPVPIEDIGLEDELIAYGINSVTYIKIIVAIEDEYEFEFEDEDLDIRKLSTLKKLIDCVESSV